MSAMKEKLIQIFYDLRTQPVIGWVTLLATAISIFLIMVVVMMQRVSVAPYPPESCRDRLMVGMNLHVESFDKENSMSSELSYECARILYDSIEGVETVSYFCKKTEPMKVKGLNSKVFEVMGRFVDYNFFNIFDHKLIEGRFFTEAESQSLLPVVILSESTARRAFGRTDCVNSTIIVDHHEYRVVGVVADSSPLATTGSGELFRVTGPNDPAKPTWEGDFMGQYSAALLIKDGVDFEDIRRRVKGRYGVLETKLKAEQLKPIYHEQPYSQEIIAGGQIYTNYTPNIDHSRHLRWMFYAILLIVPAINLSGMLHSRLRRRVNEIGVRRAYGCTRSRIVAEIVGENFLVTAIGGVIGLVAGIIFAATYTGLYENYNNIGQDLRPALSALLNWGTVLSALLICFVLNIISASIPAWQAARMDPVEAINTK